MKSPDGTLDPMAATDPERDERLRAILRSIFDGEYAGNITHTAKALGVSTALVSLTLDGSKRPGQKLIQALADHTGRSLDDLYGRVPEGTGRARRPRVVTLGELPEWPELRKAAWGLDPGIPTWCFDRLAREPAILTSAPTPAMIRDLARIVRRYLTPAKGA